MKSFIKKHTEDKWNVGIVLSLMILPAFLLSIYRTLIVDPNNWATASVVFMYLLVMFAGFKSHLTLQQRQMFIALAMSILTVHIYIRLDDVGFACIPAFIAGLILFANTTKWSILAALFPSALLFTVTFLFNTGPQFEDVFVLLGSVGAFSVMLFMFNTTLTSLRLYQRKVEQSAHFLEYSAESAQLGVAKMVGGLALMENKIIRELFFLKPGESLSLERLIESVNAEYKEHLRHLIEEAQSGVPCREELSFTLSGSKHWYCITLRCFSDEANSEYLGLTVLNNTPAREREARLLDEKQKTSLAIQSAGCGFWQYDSKTHFSSWDEQLFNIWGLGNHLAKSDALGKHWIQALHPEDKAYVLSTEKEFIRCNKKGATMTQTYRIIHPVLGIRWIEASAMLAEKWSDHHGLLSGMSRDVTDVFSSALLLEQQQDQMELALDSADVSIFELDIETDVLRLLKGHHPVFDDPSIDVLAYMRRFIKTKVEWDIYNQTLHSDNASATISVHYDGDDELSWSKIVTGKAYTVEGSAKRLIVRQDVSNLQRANLELQQTAERQKHMFAVIGHELRTPVAAIDMLLADADMISNEKLSLIQSTNDGLLNVLEDLRFIVNPEKAPEKKLAIDNPVALINRTLMPLVPMSRDHGLEIILDLPSDELLVELETQSLRQVLTNLAKNAVLHSQGSQLTVSMVYQALEHDTVDFTISLADNGKGIPEDQLDSMFDPFVRGDTTQDGTGLGLSIVKNLIDDMGGSLEVSNLASGGLLFVVNLTVTREQDTKTVNSGELNMAGLSVLLAEDDGVIRMLTERALTNLGAKVRSFKDGDDALQDAQQNPFDLVITDLMMPNMNGDELVKKLRSIGFDKPIICATAAVIGSETEHLKNIGVDQVISKPITPEKLSAALNNIRSEQAVA